MFANAALCVDDTCIALHGNIEYTVRCGNVASVTLCGDISCTVRYGNVASVTLCGDISCTALYGNVTSVALCGGLRALRFAEILQVLRCAAVYALYALLVRCKCYAMRRFTCSTLCWYVASATHAEILIALLLAETIRVLGLLDKAMLHVD